MDEYPDYGYDDFDGLPTVLDVPAERLSVEELPTDAARGSSRCCILRQGAARSTAGDDSKPAATLLRSAVQPRCQQQVDAATGVGGRCSSSSGGAWSAAAWSAPPSVHLAGGAAEEPAAAAVFRQRAATPPRPRTGVPQPTGVPPPPALHEQGKATHADARLGGGVCRRAGQGRRRTCLPSSSSSSSGGFGGGGTSTSTSRVGASPAASPAISSCTIMCTTARCTTTARLRCRCPGWRLKETPRERRLQQQRDALSRRSRLRSRPPPRQQSTPSCSRASSTWPKIRTSRMSALVAEVRRSARRCAHSWTRSRSSCASPAPPMSG